MDFGLGIQQLAVALGLGLLVGLQRESQDSALAGVRTFPLITVLGTLAAWLAQAFGGWALGAAWLALAAVIFVGKRAEMRDPEAGPGLTTEVAMLLMFGVGAYLTVGDWAVAVAIGGGAAVLLQFKGQLHGIVDRLGEQDLKAIMQFALISLVILPVLPDRAYGPYQVLNPRNIWLMVVLIVGLSLSAYIVYKFFGERAGVVLGGALGGAISSTATTVSYARRTAGAPEHSRAAAVVIIIASAISLVRIGVLVVTVAPSLLRAAAPPLGLLLAALAVGALALWWRGRGKDGELPPPGNPSELKSALLFALLYALVLLGVAFARDKFGNSGLYVVAGISGLTDVDAITLSTARLVGESRLGADAAWRLIVLAALANLVFKAGVVAALGHRELLKRVVIFFGATLAIGALLIVAWPRAAP
jgi:uncharacterized membrane protein (DUF4010 family)